MARRGRWLAAYCKSGQRPANIPTSPQTVYAGKGWTNWSDWVGTDRIGFLPCDEARDFVRALGLKSTREWRDYCASGNRPANIPASPNMAYPGKGWTTWSDWLGTGKVRSNGDFLPYDEARDFVRALGLKGTKEWLDYCKSGKRPLNIPANPQKAYAGKGWTNWGDWLGTGRPSIGPFLPYDEANAFVRPLGLMSTSQWFAYCKSGQRPANIPANPQAVYAGKGWTNWSDWVGTKRTGFLSYDEARDLVRPLGLKSAQEWLAYCKCGKRPLNIPASPEKVYEGKGWTNWSDWVGTERTGFLPYNEARDFVCALALKNVREWYAYSASGKRPLNIPASPRKVYAGEGWKGWGDWLGTRPTKSDGDYLLYGEGREFVRPLGLKNVREWYAYSASGKRSLNIPAHPEKTYAGKGWTNWGDWLGTGTKTTTSDEH
jgi:3-mercaptopyruvate sulfurtransferase SseA